jgi:hypothetical protein
MSKTLYIKEVLVTEGVRLKYYLNGEAVSREMLLDLRINLTGINSCRASDEKLRDSIPGMEVQEERYLVPLTPPSGSGHMPRLVHLDDERAYFEYVYGWYYEWRIPILRRTRDYILLDILNKEERQYEFHGSMKGPIGPWTLKPGTPGSMVCEH